MTTYVRQPDDKTAGLEALSWSDKLGLLFTGATVARPEIDETPADYAMESTTVELTAQDGVALELWHIVVPEPRAQVVLAHGYQMSKSSLLTEAAMFRTLECDVWLLDHRGSGGSGGTTTSLGWYEAYDIVAAVEHVRREAAGNPLILYGQSMGAVAALRAVALGVAPDGMVLEAPYDSLEEAVRVRFDIVGAPQFPAADLLLFWGELQLGFDPAELAPWRYASMVDCPVLQMAGVNDDRVPVDVSERVFGGFGEGARLELFEGAGHESLLVYDSRRWFDAVGDLVDGVVE